MESNLTPDRLRRYMSYDPKTGTFVRLSGGAGRSYIGQILGSPNSMGYNRIMVEGVSYLSHRLAWFYVHGCWPEAEIDHVNGNPLDNRLANLRPATREQNCRNTRRMKRNTSGLKGASFNRASGKWVASICVDGKQTVVGRFDSAEDAHAAYVKAARASFGEFARAA